MTDSDPAGEDLVFPWRMRPLSAWRLLPPLLACLGVLTLLALIFEVSEPATALRSGQARGLLLLDPSNPASHDVLNRALDRGTLLLGRQPEESAKDRDLLPLFEPSFAGFELKLKDPVLTPVETPRHHLFQANDLALPPLPPATRMRRAGGPAGTHQLTAVFHGDLAGEPLLQSPPIEHLRPQDLARLRFQAAVQASGRVEVVIPLTSSLEDRSLLPAFQSALSQTRFGRASGSGLRWGEISFVWQPTAPPAGP